MSILLSAQNLQYEIGSRTLFRIDALQILDHERIGLVGTNGAGKSTLLECLVGKNKKECGKIMRKSNIAYLPQFHDETTPHAYTALSSQFDVTDHNYSGGQRQRLMLSSVLSENAPLLLLDEPTSNLDIEGIALLEKQLQKYPGAVVMISHDRSLLDALCTTIWQLDEELEVFNGNYSDYMLQKEHQRARAEKEYTAYQTEKNRLYAARQQVYEQTTKIRKHPKRMGNSEARLLHSPDMQAMRKLRNRQQQLTSRIERLDVKQAPKDIPLVRMEMQTQQQIQSKIAVSAKRFSFSYAKHRVFSNASFDIPTGSKTALIGKNGSGKSTLINAIVEGTPDIFLAPSAKVGSFLQFTQTLREDWTVLDNIKSNATVDQEQIRGICARLLLFGDDVFKKVAVLSGGERAKVALACLFCSDSNFLILDEPTNHLDVYTLDALQQLLVQYHGTLLFSTHDRMLLCSVADRLLIIENEENVVSFEGNYAAYEKSLQKSAVSYAQKDLELQRSKLQMQIAALDSITDEKLRHSTWEQLRVEMQKINEALGK